MNGAPSRVIDPELGLNVVDLGDLNSVQFSSSGSVALTMTLTTVACPLQASFRETVEAALWQGLPELTGVDVEIVWYSPWNPNMISAAGRSQLGMH